MTYAEALEVAICFGWIDGQKRKLDEEFWLQRFTPRRPGGRWSKINAEKAAGLIEAGRMRDAGLREVEQARADGRWDSAYAGQRTMEVPDDLREALAANKAAAAFFETLNGANRYAILYRIAASSGPRRGPGRSPSTWPCWPSIRRFTRSDGRRRRDWLARRRVPAAQHGPSSTGG